MDTLVFDIETKNFFTDEGVGWNNFGALKISVVGVYSYSQNKCFCFEEDEMEELGKIFRDAEKIVGFSSNRYDVPVLNAHFQAKAATRDLDLWKMERVDLLEEIEMATGSRISLSRLAEANLGAAKSGSGAEAIELYKEGKIEELKKYCLEDVRLTKELYDIYRTKGRFLIPDKKTGEVAQVEVRVMTDQAKLF
ncbi:MAG: ribonuclease H-like domain-containing protein [Candidatus Liptonbacteria bacterium]|nr:ribonuclease H-like domain-containing protein [Candidatus Liptonbacteria bacterium]